MKMFVFEYINQVSDRYHSEGGLIVIAKDRDQVEELIKNEEYVEITEEEWNSVIEYELANDEDPRILTFPDAGCC